MTQPRATDNGRSQGAPTTGALTQGSTDADQQTDMTGAAAVNLNWITNHLQQCMQLSILWHTLMAAALFQIHSTCYRIIAIAPVIALTAAALSRKDS